MLFCKIDFVFKLPRLCTNNPCKMLGLLQNVNGSVTFRCKLILSPDKSKLLDFSFHCRHDSKQNLSYVMRKSVVMIVRPGKS